MKLYIVVDHDGDSQVYVRGAFTTRERAAEVMAKYPPKRTGLSGIELSWITWIEECDADVEREF